MKKKLVEYYSDKSLSSEKVGLSYREMKNKGTGTNTNNGNLDRDETYETPILA